MKQLLRIDASMRHTDSVSRSLADQFIQSAQSQTNIQVIHRDLTEGLPFIDEQWITANFTDKEQRTLQQEQRLALSDTLIKELEAVDTVLIALPIYNFGVPAALKAWIDLVARAQKTFRYTQNGPVGLLKDKKAIIIITSGGTAVGSDIDFATDYLRHVLGFLGIHDVRIIAADQLMQNAERASSIAHQNIETTVNTLVT
ncbi:MAG: FMN-dependent NADH-azoreductase [Arenicella sp.]